MQTSLWVGGIDKTIPNDAIFQMFSEAGEVWRVHRLPDDSDHKSACFIIDMANQADAESAIDRFDDCLLNDRIVRVQIAKSQRRIRYLIDPNSEQVNKLTKEFADTLFEYEIYSVARIKQIICVLGEEKAQSVLQDAVQIEADGGLMTNDGSRRRTLGGVFFYLSRSKSSHKQRETIWGW